MITSINGISFAPKASVTKKENHAVTQSPISNNVFYSKNLSQALKSNSLNFASTVKFTGALHGAFSDLNASMQTCRTKDDKGETVGSRANVNKLLHDFAGEFSMPGDAIKTTIQTGTTNIGERKDVPVFARTQIKLLEQDKAEDKQKLRFEMSVRDAAAKVTSDMSKQEIPLSQNIQIDMTPINYKGEGTHEQAYILNTKGNLMAVLEDGNDVLLTNHGQIIKKGTIEGELNINAWEAASKPYHSFTPEPQPVQKRVPMPSIGEGTEIVIGMEKGRFVNEIKASIKEFVRKINNEEIVLPQFKAAPNAKDTQLIMLAGGFGSRAEYTNASSDAIFHDIPEGAQSTKGVFRTATGLTPMETTFVTLHKAGLLDCSKGKIGINKNIKFYLNEGQNRGNGEFSADLYATMDREGRKSAIIFPNDSMSRMTNAVIEANELMRTGKAAIAMVAKKVSAEDCANAFGIMSLSPEGEILEFKEKPPLEKITSKFIIEPNPENANSKGLCLTNTFQFAVSDEAFEVLDMFEPLFRPIIKDGKEKESRDWSKQYVPILKTLTQDEDINVVRKNLAEALNNTEDAVSDDIILKSKAILGNQKIYAVPTGEPWADCGTLNQLFHTTMEIADGKKFQLEDFERAHVLECVDTQKGLIASSKEQKNKIKRKYHTSGQVMVVPQARKVYDYEVAKIPVTVHRD